MTSGSKDSLAEVEAASFEENARNNNETARVVDHEAERKLCFKFDIRILPVLAVMCRQPILPASHRINHANRFMDRSLQCSR